MPSRAFTLVERQHKYARVTVYNADGSFNRQFRITAAQYSALNAPGCPRPAGVTQEEWESGRAMATGHDVDTGDMQMRVNGDLLMKLDEQAAPDGSAIDAFLVLKPGEFVGTPPDITVAKEILDTADLSRSSITALDSLVNGVLTWR